MLFYCNLSDLIIFHAGKTYHRYAIYLLLLKLMHFIFSDPKVFAIYISESKVLAIQETCIANILQHTIKLFSENLMYGNLLYNSKWEKSAKYARELD